MSFDPQSPYTFPADFFWGAAAASYQIEGAKHEGGKGESVWDMFCQRPGAVFGGHSGDVACDHYHRYPEDTQLMGELGISAYRLSLSWPRLFPEGTGAKSQMGFDFYDRLVDSLLKQGITPWMTLFHWDYPLSLMRRGGWLNRDSASWFADYAGEVVAHFSDRVTNYFTLNEPQVYIGFGHAQGVHAPGFTLPMREWLLAGHHTLLGHGLAVAKMRAAACQPIQIGYAPVGIPKLPAGPSEAEIELARRATFSVSEPNTWNCAWWMDPVFLGKYPEQGLEFYGAAAPEPQASDLEIISAPIDVFGVNIYQGAQVRPRTTALGSASQGTADYEEIPYPAGDPRTAFNWPLTPDALYWGPRFFYERYNKPIVVTENGMSSRDWVARDGKVYDPNRIDFMVRYLRAFCRAIHDGVDARGYFHWSIMDNFEWAAGYRERFGLIHVDYETQKRTPKESYYWYQQLIKSHGQIIGE